MNSDANATQMIGATKATEGRGNRRDWFKGSVAGAVAGTLATCGTSPLWAQDNPKLPVAAVVTTYKKNSHADVIVGKVLEGYRQDGGAGPNLKISSMYVDQVGSNDLSRDLAQKHGIRICSSIDEAITMGTDKVQVSGVLSIGEHGDYPKHEVTGQRMYPRREFFDAIVASFRRGKKTVPVFSDKHLSYNFSDAQYMVQTAQEMGFPMMAGSSIPVAWRRPAVTLPMGCEIEAAVAVGYGGLESYGFHAIEGLQCMLERRKGGETGVATVQAARGDAVLEAEKQGHLSRQLLNVALDAMPDSTENRRHEILHRKSTAYFFEHRDGLRSSVVMANGVAKHFGFAAKIRGRAEPVAVWYELELEPPYGHFAFLLRAIDAMFQTGKPSYPVERTLLTTGLIHGVMRSVSQNYKRLPTPELSIAYQPSDWPFANAVN